MPYPILAPRDTWYTQGGTSIKKSTITEIHIRDSYTPTGPVTAQWDASAAKDGSITAYIEGTVLTMAGNGSGKIAANADSSKLFGFGDGYFKICTVIDGLDVVDTSNAETLEACFRGCMAAVELRGIETWNVGKCRNFGLIFAQASKLRTVHLENWNMESCETLYSAFYRASALEHIDLSAWRPRKVRDLTYLFYLCDNLTTVGDLSDWRTPLCEKFVGTFGQCPKLEKQRVEGWDVHSGKYFSHVFADNFSMAGTLDLSGWDMSNALDLSAFINDCNQLEYLNVTGWNTKNVKAFGQFAERCSSLRKIVGVEGLDTSSASTITTKEFGTQVAFGETFSGCTSMQELDLSSSSTASAFKVETTTMHNMLDGMIRLEKLTLGPDFDVTGSDPAALPLPPTPDPTYIPGADGHWYDKSGKAYTPEEAIKTVPNVYYASKAVLYGSELAVMDRSQMHEVAEYVRKATGRTELMQMPDVLKAMVDHAVSNGVTGAKKGDLFRVKEVDGKGVPTALEPVSLEDLEGKWELLEEFTVKEAMPLRRFYPDGLTAFRLSMYNPSENLTMAFGTGHKGGGSGNLFGSIVGGQYRDVVVKPEYGFYEYTAGTGGDEFGMRNYGGTPYNVINQIPASHKLEEINAWSPVPAKTVVKIWGVR